MARWLGTAIGPQSGRKAPASTRSVRSRSIVPWLVRSRVDPRVEVPLVGEPEDEHQRDQTGEELPAPPPRVVGLQQPPAEQREGDEDREHRAGEHRVAGDDRQAGAGEQGEGAEREDSGGEAERRAAAQEGEAEDDAAGGADHPRPLQDFAEAARAVEDEVDRAGLALQRFDRFAGAGEGVGGAAGGDRVEQRPGDRAAGRGPASRRARMAARRRRPVSAFRASAGTPSRRLRRARPPVAAGPPARAARAPASRLGAASTRSPGRRGRGRCRGGRRRRAGRWRGRARG